MRNCGEGSFFYDRSGDRWVGRVGTAQVTSRNKAKAKVKWEALREKTAAGGTGSIAPTVGELWTLLVDQKVKQGRAPSTVRWYREYAFAHIVPFSDRRADSLTVEEVEVWMDQRTHLGTNYINRLRGGLEQALNIALRRRQIVWNPASLAQVPPGVEPDAGEILTGEEVQWLLAAASGNRMEAWLHLMLNTGFRPHEAYELVWDDVNLDAMTVTARPRKAKASTPRVVAVTATTRNHLAAHKKRQSEERLLMGARWPRDHDALVFRSEVGTPMDARDTNRRLGGWLDKAGISKHIHVYDLRATVASLAADSGVPIVKLADYLGNLPSTLEKHYRQPVSPVRELGFEVTAVAAE
jgi:integrase